MTRVQLLVAIRDAQRAAARECLEAAAVNDTERGFLLECAAECSQRAQRASLLLGRLGVYEGD
jgi:hypothetical protein